jgi:fucose 4-O-acetylase-like acetyltransferase
MNTTNQRRTDLDLAKGLGIFLVVFGHIVAKTQPQGNAWYTIAQTAVYTFHMPFFLYLSGYVTFLTGAAHTPLAQWPALVRRRSERLLLPFVLFGLLFVTGKLIASRFVYVDNLPAGPLSALVDLVWNTDASPAISIWYMFVIFVAAVVTPLLLHLARGRLWLVLLAALALFALGLPHRMFADRFAGFYVFFVMGGLAAESGDRWLERIDRHTFLACALLIISILAEFWQGNFDPHWSHMICGVFAIPALHGLVRRAPLSRSRTLLVLGTYSFVIYLLNTPSIGIAKGILLKFVPWDGAGFPVHALVLLLAGLVLPVIIKRYLLRYVPVLDRITT